MTGPRPGTQRDYLHALAEARRLTQARDWTAAMSQWRQVTRANPANGDHWHSLAGACYRAGDYAQAIAAYRKVGELGVTASWEDIDEPGAVAYRLACCHARLGDPAAALEAFEAAVEQGYRSPAAAWADDDLAILRTFPRFADLTWHVATPMTRDDGWRFDARVLAGEIDRRAPSRTHQQRAWLDRQRARLPASIPRLSDAQVVLELTRWIAALDDGHGSVEVADADSPISPSLPLQFQLFAEGLHVTAAHPDHEDLLGARVHGLGRSPIAETLAQLRPLTNRDNDSGGQERVVQVLRRSHLLHALDIITDPDQVELDVELVDGTRCRRRVRAQPEPWQTRNQLPAPDGWVAFHTTLPGPAPLYLRDCRSPYWFCHLPEQALVYFQFNRVTDAPGEPFADFIDRLFAFVDAHQVTRLVIDVRFNGGGDLTLTRPLVHALIGRPRLNRPGGLYVITGRRTFSAAQYTCSAIQANTDVIFVGEPTGSRPNFVGETTPFHLPYSGLKVNISDTFWQNGWPQDRRTSIAPDLYVAPTFAAYRANRDGALEAVLAAAAFLTP